MMLQNIFHTLFCFLRTHAHPHLNTQLVLCNSHSSTMAVCKPYTFCKVSELKIRVMRVLFLLQWLVNCGEQYLKPEKRQPGYMMMHKVARVEYKPIGVVRTSQQNFSRSNKTFLP